MLPVFTIGHSNRSIDDFVDLLRGADIGDLADVRKMPMSRANPQFNGTALAATLAAVQISYAHIAALGGLRGKAARVPTEVNGFWTNKSFHNYADYALSDTFQQGLADLLDRAAQRRCAVMCAEAVWWRCHRRIITDYLIARGRTVFHIMGPGRLETARMTPGAVIQPDGTVVYPESPAL